MKKNNYLAISVGIGLCGFFAVLLALRIVEQKNKQAAPDQNAQPVVAAADAVYGSFILPETISRFEANGANGTVSIKPSEQPEQLPAGQYQVRYWKTERKDDGGNTWALAGQYYGQDNKFEIKEDNQTKLDIGEPIIATVAARNVGSMYAFNQIIKGRGQEIIELTRNGARPQPPKLHIKNKDGTYDRTFSFEYG